MSEVQRQAPWFALQIRTYDHARVETALLHKGFEVLSPYSTPAPQAPGTAKKRARTPLFPGYLFCAFDPMQRLGVLTVPGVKRILGMGPAVNPVPAREIEAIRCAVSSGLPLESVRLLEPGEATEVCSGPLRGVRGVVVNHKGRRRVVVTISALGDRAMAIAVDRELLKPISRPPQTAIRSRAELQQSA